MKSYLIWTAMLMVLTACAQLPEIKLPTASDALPSHIRCREIFPKGHWQLHHAIEATVPGGDKTLLTGVTIISEQNRTIKSALMTLEGFVLFSARFDGTLTIDRAIGPFDRPQIAQGLMDDLKFLFFAPQATLCMTGRANTNDRICRYCLKDDTIDIIVTNNQTWQIKQYNTRRRLVRSIKVNQRQEINHTPFAQKMTLERQGLLGYKLELKLLEAVALN